MNNDSKNYIAFGYSTDLSVLSTERFKGLSLKIKDNLIEEILFKEKEITVYFNDSLKNLEKENIVEKVKRKLMLALLHLESVYNFSSFYLDESEIKIAGSDIVEVPFQNTAEFSLTGSVKIEKKVDGRLLTKEEQDERERKKTREKLENQLSDFEKWSNNFSEYDVKCFENIFQIKDPVIKYFILYSWLTKLCRNKEGKEFQELARDFIKNSKTFHDIGELRRHRNRDNTKKGKNPQDEDIFTCLRNLIGHSINDALCMDDEQIVCDIKKYTPYLMKIIIEKLTESPTLN